MNDEKMPIPMLRKYQEKVRFAMLRDGEGKRAKLLEAIFEAARRDFVSILPKEDYDFLSSRLALVPDEAVALTGKRAIDALDTYEDIYELDPKRMSNPKHRQRHHSSKTIKGLYRWFQLNTLNCNGWHVFMLIIALMGISIPFLWGLK